MTTIHLQVQAHVMTDLGNAVEAQDISLMPGDTDDLAVRLDDAIASLRAAAATAGDDHAMALHARCGRYAAIRDALREMPMTV